MEALAQNSGEEFTRFRKPGDRVTSKKMFMSVYQKQHLQVQFLKFGVDHNGIIVPILKRGKDNFVQLPPVAKRANPQGKNSPPSR